MRKTMISFVIEKDVLTHVNVMAKADDKSRSQILRDAVARYLEDQARKPIWSVSRTDLFNCLSMTRPPTVPTYASSAVVFENELLVD